MRLVVTGLSFALAAGISLSTAFADSSGHASDPHYVPSGFFDIHVCNWPDRPPFYMALFRTRYFNDIESVIISNTRGEVIGQLDSARYKTYKRKGEPEQRVFITEMPLSDDRQDGWFSADIRLKSGQRHSARDLVKHRLIPHVSGNDPEPGAEAIPMPKMLQWDDVAGALWYKVFIRDMWDDEKLVYASGLLTFPEHTLPDGVLKPGGYYSWKVHARDVRNDIQLGEFNSGSQSRWIEFSVADD